MVPEIVLFSHLFFFLPLPSSSSTLIFSVGSSIDRWTDSDASIRLKSRANGIRSKNGDVFSPFLMVLQVFFFFTFEDVPCVTDKGASLSARLPSFV